MRLAIGVCGLLMTALPARASVYYVTVAGIGGEPDYEQRFTASAKDLDKVFKASERGACLHADGKAMRHECD